MKLIRFGPPGRERPGLLLADGRRIDAAGRGSDVDRGTALDHVAGYVLHNDYSERAFQLERSGQWVKGKSCDTFAPFGPFLATPDEVADVGRLAMWLSVNGKMRQRSTTANMIFSVTE